MSDIADSKLRLVCVEQSAKLGWAGRIGLMM
jgi:hypothetical protein